MNNAPKTVTIQDPRKTIFRVSGATLLVLLTIVYVSVEFGRALLDAEFMTDAAYASEKGKMVIAVDAHRGQIEAQVAGLAEMQAEQGRRQVVQGEKLEMLIVSIELADAVDLYNNADEALYLHLRYEAKDGITSSSAARRHELERRKGSSKEYRDCVLGEMKNCEALRPR